MITAILVMLAVNLFFTLWLWLATGQTHKALIILRRELQRDIRNARDEVFVEIKRGRRSL